MPPGDTARLYHALTSYSFETDGYAQPDDPRLVQSFVTDDVPTFPPPCKAYPDGLPSVALPRTWPPGETATTAILAGRHQVSVGSLDLVALARLLHLSMGIVREAVRPDGRHFRLRATGSAGGLFPYEGYVAARGVAGLVDGVHWFDPLGHRLVQIGPAPGGEATTLVVTGVPWRTGWRYTERGFRHLYWDVGAVLAQQVAVACDLGVAALVRTVFPDAAVTRLVGADGVQEFPLALLTLGTETPAIEPAGDAAHGWIADAAREFPLVSEVQRAGDGAALGEPLPDGEPLVGDVPDAPGLDEVILRRASTRILDPAKAVGREALDWMLAAALRGSRVPHFVAVHNVDGLAPGLYRWPDLHQPVRVGDLRAELFRVCAEQALGRDAAFVLIGALDLDTVDDRGYRAAQLDSGRASGRMHLAAVALGLGATGMTFVDTEVPSLLGMPLAALLLTCVGVPGYRHRAGGAPGRPEQVTSERLRDRMD